MLLNSVSGTNRRAQDTRNLCVRLLLAVRRVSEFGTSSVSTMASGNWEKRGSGGL